MDMVSVPAWAIISLTHKASCICFHIFEILNLSCCYTGTYVGQDTGTGKCLCSPKSIPTISLKIFRVQLSRLILEAPVLPPIFFFPTMPYLFVIYKVILQQGLVLELTTNIPPPGIRLIITTVIFFFFLRFPVFFINDLFLLSQVAVT